MNTATSSFARRTALVAAPAALLVALAGCAGQGASGGDTGSDRTASSSSSASTSAAGGSASSTSTALLAAVDTARDAVGSGTVISVEQEQGGARWEVLVVTDGGTEHEVHTSADGASVDGQPVTDDSDADDRAENERFVAGADLDVRQAVERFATVRDGAITELGLDDHLGAVVWEGDVRSTDGTKYSVRIDAGSGDVVTNTQDVDD